MKRFTIRKNAPKEVYLLSINVPTAMITKPKTPNAVIIEASMDEAVWNILTRELIPYEHTLGLHSAMYTFSAPYRLVIINNLNDTSDLQVVMTEESGEISIIEED